MAGLLFKHHTINGNISHIIGNMKSAAPPTKPHHVLGAVLRVMAPLARWLIRSGIGYTEFAAALKPIFLEEAQRESQRSNGKTRDSA